MGRGRRVADARQGSGSSAVLADHLSAAIDGNELILHYQPQPDLRSNRVTTVEAVIRWRHPEHGLIAALAFLGLAEQAGLMGRFTHWVLRQSPAEFAAWRTAVTTGTGIS